MSRRVAREFVVLGFGSTHDALVAESVLKDAGIDAAVIPAPLALGSTCGIAIRLEPSVADEAETLLGRSGAAPTATAIIEDV